MLIRKTKTEYILWGIWKIEESIDELYSILNKSVYESDTYLQNIKNKEKLREKLAVRVLLKHLLNSDLKIKYTETGKPILDSSNLQISISHTKSYAAVVISREETIGIDIEKVSDKVEIVKNKFINIHEHICEENKITHLLLHWSAKESIYKALNIKGIDFRNDITLQRFNPLADGSILGWTSNLKTNRDFSVEYIVEDEYVITIAYLKNKKTTETLNLHI